MKFNFIFTFPRAKLLVMCDYCQWIETVNVGDGEERVSKRQNVKKVEELKKKLEPIVIIHGIANDVDDDKTFILNVFKKIISEGYKELIDGKKAIDVVENVILQLEKECEVSKGSIIKSAALIDDEGRMGCVTGSINSSAISLARKLLHERYVSIIQDKPKEKDKNKRDNKPVDEKKNGVSGCWGIIARDRDEKMSCGRVSWEFNGEFTPSIPAATTINGCGMFIKGETCFSLAGNDEIIYIKLPARRIYRRLKNTNRHLASKKKIAKMISEFDDEIGAVFLGSFNRPVIYCKKKSFPWAYCTRNMINYGSSMDELYSEDVILDEELDCTCHWRHEKHLLKI